MNIRRPSHRGGSLLYIPTRRRSSLLLYQDSLDDDNPQNESPNATPHSSRRNSSIADILSRRGGYQWQEFLTESNPPPLQQPKLPMIQTHPQDRSRTTALPNYSPLKDILDEPHPFAWQEKTVRFASDDESSPNTGSTRNSNPESKSSNDSTSSQRRSATSTLVDSRRSSTAGWLQRHGKDMRLFKLQNLMDKKQKKAEAEALAEELQKPRSPTFVDFTQLRSDRATRNAMLDMTEVLESESLSRSLPRTPPTPGAISPRSSSSKSPSTLSPGSPVVPRKPNLRLDLSPASAFSQFGSIKSPKSPMLDLTTFLKVITPSRSPPSKTIDREHLDDAVDYINVKPTESNASGQVANSKLTMHAAKFRGENNSTWLSELPLDRNSSSRSSSEYFSSQMAMNDGFDSTKSTSPSMSPGEQKSGRSKRPPGRRAISSPSAIRVSHSAIPVDNNSIERRQTVDTAVEPELECPQQKSRRWFGYLRRKESQPPSSSRTPSVETPDLVAVPTVITFGTADALHHLPGEARRISTPPKEKNGFFMDVKKPSLIHEETDSSLLFYQPFLIPDDAHDSGSRRSATAPSAGRDWYRVRLDDILMGEDSEEVKLQKQELVALEWSLPEHLPSSPLCPLNPKYRGSSKGMCVYHGRSIVVQHNKAEEP